MKVAGGAARQCHSILHTSMNTFSKIIVALAITTLLLAGTSCHTVRGVGGDVREVGRGIQRAAN